MSHFSGHFEGASTFLTPRLSRAQSLGPLKMSLEMAHKVIVPQKKIMSLSFLNSGTLIVNSYGQPVFSSPYRIILERSLICFI
jgi:hypothetical protein